MDSVLWEHLVGRDSGKASHVFRSGDISSLLPITSLLSFPSLSPSQPLSYFSASMNLPFLGISFKWAHTICALMSGFFSLCFWVIFILEEYFHSIQSSGFNFFSFSSLRMLVHCPLATIPFFFPNEQLLEIGSLVCNVSFFSGYFQGFLLIFGFQQLFCKVPQRSFLHILPARSSPRFLNL